MNRLTIIVVLALISPPVTAHHSVLHYDGKREVVISGTVTAAKFAFPHSIYTIAVANEDGSVVEWVLSSEDPRDAERLGFAEELKNLQRGDEITVVGWPHRFVEFELRGHQLHYPDGRVVFLRRGNYIWPEDIKRLDRYVAEPSTLQGVVQDVDPTLADVQKVLLWSEENDPVARAAREVSSDRARLIGIRRDGAFVFAGVHELLVCHTYKEDFRMQIDVASLDSNTAAALTAASSFVAEYNRLLSRWWEQERASCDQLE